MTKPKSIIVEFFIQKENVTTQEAIDIVANFIPKLEHREGDIGAYSFFDGEYLRESIKSDTFRKNKNG